LQSELRGANLDVGVSSYGERGAIKGEYAGGKVFGSKFVGNKFQKDTEHPIEVITYQGKKYVALLNGEGREYFVDKMYEYNGVSDGNIVLGDVREDIASRFSKFVMYDKSVYENRFKDPEVKYFETEPYKGLPAIVPFDIENGWYAAMRQTLPGFGHIATYEESGKLTSFYLCNVGENGRAEFESGIRDDQCTNFNPGTGQIYGEFPGLSKSDSDKKVQEAIRAVNDASRQYKTGISGRINILGKSIPVGTPATGIPEIQCQDFMSPKECHLLFNVCDPVVCPSSRCNLGGTYHVGSVVQSGIIGSLALCLPNIQEKIVVPICLTGLNAGVDGLISVFEGYRDCLQINLDSGETVGICDEIHSIYLCEFFWKESLPFAQMIVPRIFEAMLGQDGRGGGEYLGVQSAWDNAERSANYMTQYYGANVFQVFQAKLTEEAGGSFCKNFASARYPASGDLLDSLLEPDSPPQYHAWFDETHFTTATVPATSHYKVFYRIFAGKSAGAFYRVYLKSPSGSSFYQMSPSVDIGSGFIARGEYVAETKDFTAPSGYQELCVNVNGKEECGFQQVSTSFALDYIEDLYAEDQAKTRVNSESECVSGTPSIYGLVPNVQDSISEAISPSIYKRGIVRVCSTDNPGKGTDVNINTKDARWIPVGNCDEGKGILKCWLDTQSVKKVVESTTIEDEILGDVAGDYVKSLLREGEYIEDFAKEIDKINEMNNEAKINYINDPLIKRAFENSQKAALFLIRGNAYANLAEKEEWKRPDIDQPKEISETEIEAGKCEDCEGVNCNEEKCLELGEILNKNCVWKRSRWLVFFSCVEEKGVGNDGTRFVISEEVGEKKVVTVVLDPGHGGGDPGAVATDGTKESDINLRISDKLRDDLEGGGYNVVLTRNSDTFLTLSSRKAFIEESNADYFMSIHSNSNEDTSKKGLEIYVYCKCEGDIPQQLDHCELDDCRFKEDNFDQSYEFANMFRQKFEEAGFDVRFIRGGDFEVLRETRVPSILVEMGYLSNRDDLILLKRYAYGAQDEYSSIISSVPSLV
jgi:N-acetylmuramoyl-L-alanine amidase